MYKIDSPFAIDLLKFAFIIEFNRQEHQITQKFFRSKMENLNISILTSYTFVRLYMLLIYFYIALTAKL